MSSTKVTVPKPQNWIASALRRPWVRLSLLIGVLIFELSFIWFIRRFGWLESVNIWTQLGVIFVAVLPLLVAAFFLIRKRFSLTSALVAFTMFAVFMGVTMRPVYEARQSRTAAMLLIESGARIADTYRSLNLDSEVPKFEYQQVENTQLSDWMARLLGDYARLPPEDEIFCLHVDSIAQMSAFTSVADRLSSLENLYLGPEVCTECSRHEAAINASGANFISLGGFQNAATIRDDLGWIANCENVRSLNLVNVSNGPSRIIESDDLGIESLHFSVTPLLGKFPWQEVVESDTVRSLKFLSVQGYLVSNADAQCLSQLGNLRSLWVNFNSLKGFNLLHQMPNLRYVGIQSLVITPDQLGEFKIPANLDEFHLMVSGTLISEAEADEFKSKAPKGCKVTISRL